MVTIAELFGPLLNANNADLRVRFIVTDASGNQKYNQAVNVVKRGATEDGGVYVITQTVELPEAQAGDRLHITLEATRHNYSEWFTVLDLGEYDYASSGLAGQTAAIQITITPQATSSSQQQTG